MSDVSSEKNLLFLSDYHYVTREVMQAAIANGEFVENAEFSGNMYGTRYSPLWKVLFEDIPLLKPLIQSH